MYEDVRNKPEMRAKDLGERRLKNVPRPIRVYSLAMAKSHFKGGTEGNT
jgi:class 3 adenylate cyclase